MLLCLGIVKTHYRERTRYWLSARHVRDCLSYRGPSVRGCSLDLPFLIDSITKVEFSYYFGYCQPLLTILGSALRELQLVYNWILHLLDCHVTSVYVPNVDAGGLGTRLTCSSQRVVCKAVSRCSRDRRHLQPPVSRSYEVVRGGDDIAVHHSSPCRDSTLHGMLWGARGGAQSAIFELAAVSFV